MKTKSVMSRVCFIAFVFPVIFCACSSENDPEPEDNKTNITVKTYKVGSFMEVEKEEEGVVTKSSTSSGEYKSNTLYIMGQNASDVWEGLPCNVERSISDKVYFSFYVDVTSENNVAKSFTFRNNSKNAITVPVQNNVYYSSVADHVISMQRDAGWLLTPNGAATYKPYIESNYYRAKNCPLGVCAQGNPMIGEDIIYEDRNNELTVYLERLTAVFAVRIVLTNNMNGISEDDWGIIFNNYGEPSDWSIASYLTDFPVGYNMQTKAFTGRGIVGLHDSNLPTFLPKSVYIYMNDEPGNARAEDTYVAGSEMRPRVFYYADDRRPDVQVAIYYKYGQAAEELRIASVPIPRFNSNQNWTLNLYVDVQDLLNTQPVTKNSVETKSFKDISTVPVQSYSWETN